MKKKKILAVFLAVFVLLGSFPITAISESNLPPLNANETEQPVGSEGTSNKNNLSASTEYTQKTQGYVSNEIIGNVEEIISLREENVKHFRLADGSYEAVSFANPVHRKDQSGEWQNINNNLTLRRTDDNQRYFTDDARVSFASSFKYGTELFVLSENGYEISMVPIGTGKLVIEKVQLIEATAPIVTNVQKRTNTTVFDSMESAIQIDNKTSIVYNDIGENTAIEYILEGNNIKENIIIKAKNQSYEYAYQLNLSGLSAKLDEAGNILIKDSKTEQLRYIIPAPFMYDANGEISYDVRYELKFLTTGQYVLTISASEEWINAENRAFPVTVDPTVQTSIWIDTYIDSANPNTSYATANYLLASQTRTALIKPYMPNLPLNISSIDSAKLYVSYYGASDSFVVSSYEVTGMISENTTYNNAPSISTKQISSIIVWSSSEITEYSPRTTYFDITQLFKNWYYSATMTYGVAIKYYSGSTTVTARIKSSETECAPYLRVKYSQQIPDGVYAIKNVEYSTYMTVENGSVSSGSYVRHKTTTDSPANTFDRSSLFKITGSNGAYIIRSMTNNTLTLDLSYVEIRTKTIPPRDEDVANEDKFDIVKQGSSYLIYPYNSNKVILTIEPEGDPLCVLEKSTTQKDREMWTFEQYTGNHQIGATIFHPVSWGSTGIVNGITETVSVGGWSTYVDINAWSIDVIPGYEKLCDVKLNNAQNRITITTNNPGTIWLDVNNLYSDMTIANTTHFNFAIVPKEGTYYIQNVGTGRYIDLESASMASGAIIQQWNFHTEDQAKWIVEHVEGEGGYVRLKSLKSNLYIGVNPDDTSVICQYAANQYTLWMVDTTDDGNLKLTNKATNGTGNVLTVPLNQNLNGTNLTQISYTNDENKRDEWYLLTKVISFVNYYDGTFLGNTELIQNIETANQFANMVYAKFFGIGIYMDGAAEYRTTSVDNCTEGTNKPCSEEACGSICGQHHKNSFAISNQLYNAPREDDHIYVLWSDYEDGTFCSEIDGKHTVASYLAIVWNDRPVIQFAVIGYSEANWRLANMTLNLIHEIAHCFTMDEVYLNTGHDGNGTNCVMEMFDHESAYGFYDSVKNEGGRPFCSSCEATMRELTSNIIIQGN